MIKIGAVVLRAPWLVGGRQTPQVRYSLLADHRDRRGAG